MIFTYWDIMKNIIIEAINGINVMKMDEGGITLVIGICDDNESDIKKIEQICKKIMLENQMICRYISFVNGEEVLNYCKNLENEKIDLLFLDVELPKMSGIELKEQILKYNLIYRITFVTNHRESILHSFSLKTIGFINKPVLYEEVNKMIHIVLEEIKENILISYTGYNSERIKTPIEDILYFEADGSYTKIYTCVQSRNNSSCEMLSKKLGQIEKELRIYGFIRVHKSYLVNLSKIIDLDETVIIKDFEISIPIGRKYKEQVRKDYLLYGKGKLKKRL